MTGHALRGPTQGPSTRGFTLLEMLVVIGVIAVLGGLLLPAVQQARESARRVQCQDRLRQMILATNAYAAAEGGFPPGVTHGRAKRGKSDLASLSVHVVLLPYLDQRSLYDSINVDLPMGDRTGNLTYQSTAAMRKLDVFLCTSDPQDPHARSLGPTSYRGCTGVESTRQETAHPGVVLAPREEDRGAFSSGGRPLALAEFRDGMACTLAFSEKPIGSGPGGAYHGYRDWIEWDGPVPPARTADDWVGICSEIRLSPLTNLRLDSGESWMVYHQHSTYFLASAPPNSTVPDCGTSDWTFPADGVFAARSHHPGGVNAAMADGSVRWFPSSITPRVWRALGTRGGAEPATDPF